MSRIPTPATIADAPEKSQPLLEAVNKQLGVGAEHVPPDLHQPAGARGIPRPLRRARQRRTAGRDPASVSRWPSPK